MSDCTVDDRELEPRFTIYSDGSLAYYADLLDSHLNPNDKRTAYLFARTPAYPLDGTNGHIPAAKVDDNPACEIMKRVPEAVICAAAVELVVELAHAVERAIK